MNWEKLFLLLAVVFGALGAFFLWRGQTDPMFVSGVLGAVAFFLSFRMQVRDRLDERAAREEIHSSADSDVN
jgi:hypothetical protein